MATWTRLLVFAAVCHRTRGSQRPEGCPEANPGNNTPSWDQLCGVQTCAELYKLYTCDAFETNCAAACGFPCCRAAPSSALPISTTSVAAAPKLASALSAAATSAADLANLAG